MNSQNSRLPENKDYRTRSAFIVTLIYMVASIIASSYLVIQALQVSSWQTWVAAVATILIPVAGVVSLILISRGRSESGVWFLMIVTYIAGITLVTVISGIGILILVSSVFFSSMVAIQALRSRQAIMFTTGIVVGVIALFIDFFITTKRIGIPSFEGLINIFVPVIVLLFGVMNFRQFRQLWTTGNIQTKIVLWAGIGFFLSSAFVIGYAGVTFRNTVSRSAEEAAQGIAREKAFEIQTALERTLSTAEAFTQSVLVVKTEGVQLSRDQVNAMLRQMLKDNPQYVGVDVLWEPNAFDGMDAKFKNTEGSDANGRFLPYWTRGADGKIQVELLQDYDTSDWYQCPKKTKVSCLIDPLIYPVQGRDVLMTSVVVPFVVDDTFYGITGIDTPVSFLQELADKADISNGTGSMAILSNNGTILGATGRPELIGQPATSLHDHFAMDDYQTIKNGEERLKTTTHGDEGFLEVFAPIRVGDTVTPWSVNITIPQNVILAEARRQMWNMIGIGGTLLVLSLAALFYTARQIARPIRHITEIAQLVTRGNLEVIADVKSMDETGVLANAFNQMTAQMRDFIATLESRVAERTRNLELAAEVGRTVSQVRALDVMLTDAAELIREQFDLYYVQVYLTDASRTNLILQSGTGSVGRELISRGHRLPLDINSINGRAAVEKKSVVISDTAAAAASSAAKLLLFTRTKQPDQAIPDADSSNIFRPNPLLPDTRSEMAVPLMVSDKVVGVLDLQSSQAGVLSKDNLSAFEALAGQLAIAIQNANLLEEARQARAEVEAQARRLARASWLEYLDAIHKPEQTGFVFERNQVAPLTQEQPERESALTAPITVTGEALGKLVVEMEGKPPIARVDELIDTVARQMAQQIESLRLLDSAERFRHEAEQASRRLLHEGWQDYMDANAARELGYIYDLKEVRPCREDEIQQTDESFNLPLKVQDETIGKLVVQGIKEGDEEAVALARAVAERLSGHIEGLRLSVQTEQALTATKRQAQREQALRQITSAVRGSNDPAVILRTAARELGNILGRQTVVKLATTGETQPSQADRSAEAAGVAVANDGENQIPDKSGASENTNGGMSL